jgi:cytochrome c556
MSGPTRRQAITVALIALVGTLGAAAINLLPSFCSRKEVPKPNVSVSSSTVSGSVVGGNQSITYQIFITSNDDLKRAAEQFKTLSPEAAKQLRAKLSAEAEQSVAFKTEEQNIATPAEKILEARMEELARLGFVLTTINTDFTVENRSVIEVLVPVTKGLEYYIVTVGSSTMGALRAYIFDEDGKAVVSDLRGDQGIYSFHATYTGAVEVFLEADQVHGPSQILCVVGQRGEEEAAPQVPRTLGWEPTFKMESTPSASPSDRKRK